MSDSTLQVLMLLFHFLCSSHNSEPSLEITDNFQKSLKVSIIRLNTTKQIKIFSKCRRHLYRRQEFNDEKKIGKTLLSHHTAFLKDFNINSSLPWVRKVKYTKNSLSTEALQIEH